MSKWVMTDIHGDFMGMMKLLQESKFNPAEDQIVFIGDMIDRGKQSGRVLKEIFNMQKKHPTNVKATIGNHEEMMRWHNVGHTIKEEKDMWLIHGGKESQLSFNKELVDSEEREEILNWAYNLPLFIEDEEYIYTHAGIDPSLSLEQQSRDILWMEEGRLYGYDRDELLAATGGKPIIHGHTPVEYIYFDGARMNCDLGSNSYSIIEERGLALVNLTEKVYYVYKSHTKTIEKRNIMDLTSR